MARIMLDPGHGGDDTGACANGIVERNLNLLVAQEAQELLQAAGHEVRLTRQDNAAKLSLFRRANLSVCWPAEVFVSVHHDADGSEGCVAFYDNADAHNGKDLATKLGTALATEFGLGYSWGDPACLWTYEGHISHLGVLANCDNWRVADAALIECLMLTNSSDAAKTKAADYPTRAGHAVASAIQTHIGGDAIARPGVPPDDDGHDTPPPGQVSSWAAEAAAWMRDSGLSDATRPHDPCTREEIWCYLQRLAKLVGKA